MYANEQRRNHLSKYVEKVTVDQAKTQGRKSARNQAIKFARKVENKQANSKQGR